MAIIVNGTVIPTDGDYIKVGSTLLEKVDVVKNSVRTTVWEKNPPKYLPNPPSGGWSPSALIGHYYETRNNNGDPWSNTRIGPSFSTVLYKTFTMSYGMGFTQPEVTMTVQYSNNDSSWVNGETITVPKQSTGSSSISINTNYRYARIIVTWASSPGHGDPGDGTIFDVTSITYTSR